ncbi:MAG: GAF domain-containing protein [Proteobacteria bacterium]|nr:GAF domain-containing protein [Pseudomonadota bacterium]
MFEISSQKPAQRLEKAREINDVLHDISQAINESIELDDLFGKIHNALGKIIDVTNFFIALFQSDKNTVTFPFFIDSVVKNDSSKVYPLEQMKGSLTAKVISTGEPLFITWPDIQKMLDELGHPLFGKPCAVWLGVPLRIQGKVTGVIAVQNYEDKTAYTYDDIRLLSMVSDQVAIAIELKLKEKSVKESESRYRNLVEKIREIIYLTDSDGNIVYVSPIAENLLGMSIEQLTGDRGYYRYRYADESGERKNFDKFIYQEDLDQANELFQKALTNRKSFQLEYRIKTKKGKLNWVIEKGQFFKDEDGRNRLEGIILNHQEQKRAEMINKALFNISNAVNATDDLDDLYRSIHKSLQLVLNADIFFIALYDAEEDVITFPYKKDLVDPHEIEKITDVSNSTSLTGVVIRKRKPLLLTKQQSFQLVENMGGKHIGKPPEIWLGVPLMIRSEVIGAMVLQSYEDPNLYSEEDSEILISVSEQVATAIERKRAEAALKDTQEMLIESAHKAGMAEIASGTLHNVGNILNTVKVSTDVISSINRESSYFLFKQANKLLKENFDNLDDFFLNNPKGKQLLEYYLRLESTFESENRQIQEQIYRLHDKIQLMTDVIFDQQAYAGGGLLVSEHPADEIINTVLKMQAEMLSKHHIHVVKRFNPAYKIKIHKTKFIHVLINLVKNAKDSMLNQPEDNRKLIVGVDQVDDQVLISVEDNGEGIAEAIKVQLFHHGFTTKKDGHGFGLHNSANYMQEMQGEIRVESKGPKQGAIFTLVVPCVR